jgi:uncharacterized protein YceH (UPF0502 family)
MEIMIDAVERRVLGSLVEKELATPEYYPLTLNSLTLACNQKSNRNPVMKLDESDVMRALNSLKSRHLASPSSEGGRVQKYSHLLFEKMDLERAELAIIAELLLRGPQTPGELKARTGRMAEAGELSDVEVLLGDLAERGFLTRLPRRPGMKEQRYAHLFSGEPIAAQEDGAGATEEGGLQSAAAAENERLSALEEEVRLLRNEVAELRQTIADFKEQFE